MIDRHTLEVLEFPRVLALAARHAASSQGAEQVQALLPSLDRDEVERRLALTDELRRLLVSARGFPVLDAPDVRPTLTQLEAVGVVLEALELKALAAVAALARQVRDRFKDEAADFPLAAGMAGRLVPAPQLERAVAETFGPHGDILDSASPALKQIRRNLRQQRERIVGRLESLARPEGAAAERTVTLRGDRYVLAVRAAEKSSVGGIVHDRSATGATVFLEPVSILEENNRLIELLSEERDEVRRILTALSDMARGLRVGLAVDFELLAALDTAAALARLAERQQAVRPSLAETGDRLVLRGFRHPLLLVAAAERDAAGEAGRPAVPLDLALSPAERVLLVTGPNMGGKTVALKGVGLSCLMAAVGLHLPAAPGTEVPVLNHVVADIGDEQSIEHDLSTFGSRLKRWIDATREAGPGSLALLDEIGAGTDPAEGAALAQAVLERLADAGGLAMATTHLGALKRFASRHPGVMNGSMRFDPATEKPLYILEQGLPGQSRALEMARRLGLPEPLLNRAASLVGTEEQNIQALLKDLEQSRAEAEAERRAARVEHEAARQVRATYEERARRLGTEYAGLKQRAAREGKRVLDRAAEILKEAEKTAQETAREAALETAAARRRIEDVKHQVEAARRSTQAALPVEEAPGRPVMAAEVKTGTRYWAAPLHTWVTALAPPGGGDKVRVERNGVRVELPLSALRTSDVPAPVAAGPRHGRGVDELPPDDTPSLKPGVVYERPDVLRGEVDLRGLTAEEALERLEAYLDEAMLGGLAEVRIIHGKGTGALRQAVRKWLSGRSDVVSHRLGETWEGGTGVTVARLEE